MKKLVVLGLLAAIGWVPYQAAAQVSINVNIGAQPLWGPVGYDYVDYYYLPDIECYYHVQRRQFIYLDNRRWIFSASLPSRYRHYNLYNGYKVVVNSRNPYRNFDSHRARYSRYRHTRGQQVIRYSNDSRYYAVKGHPRGGSKGWDKKFDRRDHDRGRDRWDGDRNYGNRNKGGDRDWRGNDRNDGRRGNDRNDGRRGNDWNDGRRNNDRDHGKWDKGNGRGDHGRDSNDKDRGRGKHN